MIAQFGPMMMSLLVLAVSMGCSTTKGPVSEESDSKTSQPAEDKQLQAGDMAPTFKLKSLDGKEETDLAAFKGKKPVVLFFGSYT